MSVLPLLLLVQLQQQLNLQVMFKCIMQRLYYRISTDIYNTTPMVSVQLLLFRMHTSFEIRKLIKMSVPSSIMVAAGFTRVEVVFIVNSWKLFFQLQKSNQHVCV